MIVRSLEINAGKIGFSSWPQPKARRRKNNLLWLFEFCQIFEFRIVAVRAVLLCKTSAPFVLEDLCAQPQTFSSGLWFVMAINNTAVLGFFIVAWLVNYQPWRLALEKYQYFCLGDDCTIWKPWNFAENRWNSTWIFIAPELVRFPSSGILFSSFHQPLISVAPIKKHFRTHNS